jgi:hypothetical protein
LNHVTALTKKNTLRSLHPGAFALKNSVPSVVKKVYMFLTKEWFSLRPLRLCGEY